MISKAEKSVLITGCSSGIGLGCALGLQQRGYRVFAAARKPKDVEDLRAKGLNSYLLDLDDGHSIKQAVEEILSETGGTLYALFNNAAYTQPGAVEDLSRDMLRKNFETNVFGTHELTCEVIKIMRRQGYGRIIQNSSFLGQIPMVYRGSYNASKHALEGLTDTLRLELYDTNIKVSLIEPGPIKSNFRKNAYAMFKKNIDMENSVHRKKYEGLVARLTKKGPAAPFTRSPEAVLVKLLHALESSNPKIRYPVTVPAHFFIFMRRYAPRKLLDRLLLRISNFENR